MPQIEAHILDPSGVARQAWPVSTGVPFAKGELKSARNVRALDAKGKELPSHADVRATWPDGSVKWVLMDFQTDIGPMERRHFAVDFGPRVRRKAVDAPVRVTHRDGEIEIDTGAIRVALGTQGGRLFRRVLSGGHEHLSSGGGGEFAATDADGKVYRSQIACAYVEEENPLKVVVKAQGGFVGEDGARLMSWVVRVHAYAGKPFLRVYHTFIHDQPAAFVHLKSLRASLFLAETGPKRVFFGARVGTFSSGHTGQEGERITVTQPKPNFHFVTRGSGERQVHRMNANGWAHVAGAATGVTVKLRRPFHSYPKAIATDGQVIDLDLYPALSPEDVADTGVGRNYTDVLEDKSALLYVGPLKVPQGMARTHEVFLGFGPQKTDERHADAECIAFEQPLLPVLPSAWYAKSGALGAMAPYLEDHWPLEQRFREMCALPDGTGILNEGDNGVRLATIDGQLRTLTTDNVAYDISRSLVRTFIRTGHQMTFWAAEAGVHHLIDVDTVHANTEHPEWVGGPHMQWSQNHHYRTTDEVEQMRPVTSHTWIGGLLDFYFLTGYRRAWDVACQTAEFCRVNAPVQWLETMTPEAKARVLDYEQKWSYSTRVAGWPLVAMGQMYEVTREEKFLAPMRKLLDLFVMWQDEQGKWRDQTGSFNRGSKPFMISSILQGLQKYYENFGDRRALNALVKGARHVATELKTVEGLLYYTEGPHSDRAHSSDIMELGPMAFVFEKEGDPEVLDAAYRFFRWMVDGKQCSTYTHKDAFAFMPLALRLGLLEDYRGVDVRKHIPKKKRSPSTAKRGKGARKGRR